jgi:superfamily I DNA/RNA helicase
MRFSAPAAGFAASNQAPEPARSRFAAPGATSTPLRSGLKPTPEQDAILTGYNSGQTIAVEALAGTGKTTTLKMLAASTQMRDGVYLAYNKSIVQEARGGFPGRVQVGTAHSFAYRAVGHRMGHRLPGRGGRGGQRLRANQIATMLNVRAADAGNAKIAPAMLVRLAEGMVNEFCRSGEELFNFEMLPARAEHLGDPHAIADAVIPIARKMWADLTNPDGKLYYTHSHYLKQWQLTSPKLYTDYILFDEAQDANPCIAAIVAAQTHAQRVYVGDRNQAIMGWNGAIDAMAKVEGERFALTKSFRFGPAIAEAANEWLDLLGSPHRLVGHDPIQSRVGTLTGEPDAVLCRTNGGALGAILNYQERGIRVAMAPGDATAGKDILSFAYAARDLMGGKATDHPDLAVFTTWRELLDYVDEEEGGSDLGRLVNIVNRIGPHDVITAIRNLVTKARAQVTVSTAHKAKGLEWDRVSVASDFAPPTPEEQDAGRTVEPADLMLAYVTVTRAKLELMPGALDPMAWVE